ncbi:DUF6167 family protein [Nocardioides sp. CER19]|uniref:DUF6167 family protein n=1 Tax=Nocardioides sp. CER19 TaxID=3038538 RepID=UPI002446D5B2|nr:DUF6167 family protein [Nocardioides sp. CER19]MDH2416433.1 DUF6167 family protein [Nocardioides sp. CER19]
MRRGLWFLAGAGIGVYAMVRGRRAAEAFTGEGLHDRWQALELGARLFRDEVATGKAEAEARLRERFGPTYDPQRQLAAPQPDASSALAAIDSSNDFQEGPQ